MSDLTDLLRGLLRLLGLDNLPAIPIDIDESVETLLRLAGRELQTLPSVKGLSTTYTIDGQTATGREFLFGKTPLTARADTFKQLNTQLNADGSLFQKLLAKEALGNTANSAALDQSPLTQLSLDDPTQWTISWTTDPDIYDTSQPLVEGWAATLTDSDVATAQFWPNLAKHGLAYNLLILEKVGSDRIAAIKANFQGVWNNEWDTLSANGLLYAIDLSIFSTLESKKVDGFDRFTPATITLLAQDPQTKALAPVAVRVWGKDQNPTCFVQTDNAWLYALQAAKTSATVYGIWLGHVYHWHIVSAAMQMTMFETLPANHNISLLLAPQSKYLIGFDDVLLLLWDTIAPPTSVASPLEFFELINAFAKNRGFFEDDPIATLKKNGITQSDFSDKTPWDQFPIAGQLLTLWGYAEQYVNVFVETSYKDDLAVANDAPLQAWLVAAAADKGGNIQGLGTVDSKPALIRLLTSLVFRLTAHGVSRLNATANPALSFVANFPPCLQDTQIPDPNPTVPIDTVALLKYLPRTGTIGSMVTFYFTFVFSEPYEPLIPKFGVTANLFFPNLLGDPRNGALVRYRRAIASFIEDFEAGAVPQYRQWPMSIET